MKTNLKTLLISLLIFLLLIFEKATGELPHIVLGTVVIMWLLLHGIKRNKSFVAVERSKKVVDALIYLGLAVELFTGIKLILSSSHIVLPIHVCTSLLLLALTVIHFFQHRKRHNA